jgi:ATP-dependent DNA ligase
VLDGEICCVDGEGRPVFTNLLFRKSTCIFVAFDLLYLNGKDLRTMPLIELERKRLFEQIVKMDIEGIVCKRKSSPYRVTEKPSPYWIKVKNPRYSPAEGRETKPILLQIQEPFVILRLHASVALHITSLLPPLRGYLLAGCPTHG